MFVLRVFKFTFLPLCTAQRVCNLEFQTAFTLDEIYSNKVKVRYDATVKSYLETAVRRISLSASLKYNSLVSQMSYTNKLYVVVGSCFAGTVSSFVQNE